AYVQTGVLDKEFLSRLGKAMNVDYLIQPGLVRFSQEKQNRITVFGVRLVQTMESTVRVFIEIWDVRTGALVWNGWAVVTFAGEDIRARPVLFETVTERAYGNLLERLVNSQDGASPSP
ncbi:MAG: hypothetical protein ACE5LX_03075, partial [Nitrospinota bacterium]